MITQRSGGAKQDQVTEDAPLPATLPEALARAAGRPVPAALAAGAAGAPGRITHVREGGDTVACSYADLCQQAERVLAGLRRLGLAPGDPVILHLDDNADYLAAFWACVLGGFVAAPLIPSSVPGSVTARLRAAWELCGQPPVIVGAAPAGLDGDWPWTPRPRLATVDSLRSAGQAPYAEGWHASGPDDVLTLLFTSGSTGIPKAAALTHRNVLTMIKGYIGLEGLNEREVTFNWMPLDHAAGLLAFHLRDVYLGCDQVHATPAAILADPLRWLDWLDHFGATCTWAPNFAFSLINDQLAAGRRRDWDLSRLHHIMTAGEMIVAPTVRRFLALLGGHGLPPSAIHPSWGMSETSGGVTFSSDFRLTPAPGEGRFVELGRIIPGAALRVVDDAGNVLPDGEPGRIQVSGPTVTPGYFRNPEADKAAFTPDGWFDTGDIGSLRDGRLTMTGRAKDIIIVNGLNYYCHEIEAATEEVPGVVVTCTAACAVRDGRDTDALVIFYCTELREEVAAAKQWDAIRKHVTAVTGISPQYLLPVGPGAIPRTETGKIRREKLRQLFDQGAFDSARVRSDELAAVIRRVAAAETSGQSQQAGETPSRRGRDGEEQALIQIWQSVLDTDRVTPHDDFFDLGGDSLASMRIVSLADEAGIRITQDDIMASRTVARLAALVRGDVPG